MRHALSVSVCILSAIGLGACQSTSSVKPDFSVSQAFDGQWRGERVDVSGDTICRQTTIVGTVASGEARLWLSYNQTLLTGWIASNGDLTLSGNSPRWDYKFSGKAEGNAIKGDWSVGNAPCRGTWYVTRS